MDNYINLTELRQVAESLLYKINTIADTKVDNYNVVVNASDNNNYDDNGNYIIGAINGNELKIPYKCTNNALYLDLNNNTISLWNNDEIISSIDLPVYNGGVSG